jgi:hypothetical protein
MFGVKNANGPKELRVIPVRLDWADSIIGENRVVSVKWSVPNGFVDSYITGAGDANTFGLAC